LVLPALIRNHSSNSNSSASSSTFNQQAVCQLLCCSKAISRGVQAECSRQLSAHFCAQSLQQSQWFAAWLARNAGMLQQLQLSFHERWQNGAVGGTFSAGVPVAVAGALNIAAVRGSLQHLQSWVDHMPSPAVLNALAGVSSLTRLELDFSAVSGWYGTVKEYQHARYSYNSEADDDDLTTRRYQSDGREFTQMHKALAGLTQLRELSLHWSTPFHPFNPLWPALRDLWQLTALTTTYAVSHSTMTSKREYKMDVSHYLPASLKKLVVLPGRCIEDENLGRVLMQRGVPFLGDLAHLTCLTELRAPAAAMGEPDFEQWGHGYWPRVTDDDDVRTVLPASLEVLQLGHVQPLHMQQLRQLSKLHSLAIEGAVGLSVEQLQQLQDMDEAQGG
jgi:hypothetical protein